jgi:hypothetical protein
MKTWSLINYFDVWGNTQDGWEVNNMSIVFNDLVIAENSTNKDIVKYLYDIGFLNTHDMRRIVVEDMGDMIEIHAKKGLKPVCSLRLNY